MSRYSIHTDVKYGPLELIEAGKLADDCPDPWWNQTLCQVNDSVARLGVFEPGDFHWHQHDREDELFFVLEGKLLVDLRGDEERTVELLPRQGFLVPKGVQHRTRAPPRARSRP